MIHQSLPTLSKRILVACLLLLALLLTTGFVVQHIAAGDNVRTIDFAGHEWIVKSGYGGPGPNHWSNDADSVWVDDEGALHLKIRQIEGVWHSAEVYTPGCTAYTTHRFSVKGQIDALDPNTVAAVFLYQDDDTEIDIEFSRWGNADAADNAQYVVQPYFHDANRHRFAFDLAGAESTHAITWLPDSIEWKSIREGQANSENAANLVQHWAYAGSDVPPSTACMRVHINHWLLQGFAPSDGQPSELVISDVRLPGEIFLPLAQRAADGPTPTPGITVSAEGDKIWGAVVPSQYCNDGYKVAAYAKKDIWYVQPFKDGRRNIRINSDCTWRSSTHDWDQIAVFLVTADYEISGTIRKPNCPPLPLDPESDPLILAGVCIP